MTKKKTQYTKGTIPADYMCATCGATGCKLWRDHVYSVPLLCVDCACQAQGKSNNVDEEGLRTPEGSLHTRTDQIGWYVPAVPYENGEGYTPYCDTPEDGVKWWKQLPLRPAPVVSE